MRMAVMTRPLGAVADAVICTGEPMETPDDGDVTLTPVALALTLTHTVRMIAAAVRRKMAFKSELLEKCPEEPKVGFAQLPQHRVSGWLGLSFVPRSYWNI